MSHGTVVAAGAAFAIMWFAPFFLADLWLFVNEHSDALVLLAIVGAVWRAEKGA